MKDRGEQISFSFKPITSGIDDISTLSSQDDNDSLDVASLPPTTEMFGDDERDFYTGSHHIEDIQIHLQRHVKHNDSSNMKGEDDDDDDAIASACRVISPYPFSHTSHDEITGRMQLLANNAISWTLDSDDSYDDDKKTELDVPGEHCWFYAMESDIVMDDCDDFSVSINGQDSLSRDLGLEDPAAFWEEGASTIPHSIIIQRRSNSPNEVSLGGGEVESSTMIF